MFDKKTSKIAVLHKMMGIVDEEDGPFLVPQNSMVNVQHRMGLTERRGDTRPPIYPIVNSTHGMPSATQCPHCENMAKNFLYLESLIRTNYDPKYECSLCYSSLKYLQYVNKSILQVFGKFDSIVQAAKAFSGPPKQIYNAMPKSKSRSAMASAKSKSKLSGESLKTKSARNLNKQQLPKKKSKTSKISTKPTKQGSNSKNAAQRANAKNEKIPKSRSMAKVSAKPKSTGKASQKTKSNLKLNDSNASKTGKKGNAKKTTKSKGNKTAKNRKNVKSQHNIGELRRVKA